VKIVSADSHDLLRVEGARENNLKNVSVSIPKRPLTVFTGVSGSGKSSLVFGTIAAESQRLINETYSAFVQGFKPTLARPDVEVLEGLTTAILVGQERIGGNSRSTVGTATDANAMLRVLFSRLGKPHIGSPKAFAFNVPSVSGVGRITTLRRQAFPGVRPRLQARRLDIAQVLDLSVKDAVAFFETRTPAAHAILRRLDDVGLGYLRLGQPLTTLSGGERQRLKLATHLGEDSGIYVLDEPTTGLHLADLEQLLVLLDGLVDAGKSVIVIEHHQAVMVHADWIIDLGPGAGHDGGRVVFEGTPAALVAARSTLTGNHLAEFVGGRPKIRSKTAGS